jgi:hypothetical protein
MPTKFKYSFQSFFAYYFLKVHLISVFKDKKSKRSHKIVETKVFLTFFACLWKDPYLDPGCPKTYGSYGSVSKAQIQGINGIHRKWRRGKVHGGKKRER